MRSTPPSGAAPPFSVTLNPPCRNPSATRLSNCCHVSDATAGPLAARGLSSRRIDRYLLKNDTAAPDEKGRWHHKLQEECADVNGLVNDDATHVGDRGDGGCGR